MAEEEESIPEEKESQGEKEEPAAEKSSGRSAGIILIFLLVLALAFGAAYTYRYYQNSQEYDELHREYNYYTFEKASNESTHWKTTWMKGNQPYILSFRHWPGELEDIAIEGRLSTKFNNSREIYITFDPEDENLDYVAVSASELSLNLVKALGKKPVAACKVNKTSECATRPIIKCRNSTEPVIYLKQADNPLVKLSGNCMTIQGRDEELVMATERILYVWYGIMER